MVENISMSLQSQNQENLSEKNETKIEIYLVDLAKI